jgi:hypothetical protein
VHLVPFCSIQLRQAQKECDEVKQLYIEVCSSKEKLIATLELEQKAQRDLANLLDAEAERFKKIQAELDTEKRKVRALAEVLNILSLFMARSWYLVGKVIRCLYLGRMLISIFREISHI